MVNETAFVLLILSLVVILTLFAVLPVRQRAIHIPQACYVLAGGTALVLAFQRG
jgi:hypothetical protein